MDPKLGKQCMGRTLLESLIDRGLRLLLHFYYRIFSVFLLLRLNRGEILCLVRTLGTPGNVVQICKRYFSQLVLMSSDRSHRTAEAVDV